MALNFDQVHAKNQTEFTQEIHYPESDGQPMAESDLHRDYLKQHLVSYALGQDNSYAPMTPVNQNQSRSSEASDLAAPPELLSQVLGLRLTVDPENQLVIYEEKRGRRLLSDEEARIEAESKAKDAADEAQCAKDEAERVQNQFLKAQSEIEELKAQLEQLKREKKWGYAFTTSYLLLNIIN